MAQDSTAKDEKRGERFHRELGLLYIQSQQYATISYFNFKIEALAAFDVHAIESWRDENREDVVTDLNGEKPASRGRPLEGLQDGSLDFVDVAAEAVRILEIILDRQRRERAVRVAGFAKKKIATGNRSEDERDGEKDPDGMGGGTSAAGHGGWGAKHWWAAHRKE
jgi:hypothetical protein